MKYLSAESPPRFRRLYTRYLFRVRSARLELALEERSYALRDLTQSAAFLAEVYDETNASSLRATNALLDRIYEVGLASANVGTEYVGAVA